MRARGYIPPASCHSSGYNTLDACQGVRPLFFSPPSFSTHIYIARFLLEAETDRSRYSMHIAYIRILLLVLLIRFFFLYIICTRARMNGRAEGLLRFRRKIARRRRKEGGTRLTFLTPSYSARLACCYSSST